MSTQNPFFSFLTTYPGGTPLNNPDTTQSKDIEIGADGPHGDPLEIIDNHNGALRVLTPAGSVYNQSGRYLHRELNMLDGVHTFGLRANSSSAPSHQWVLTVGAAETLTIDSIKGLISGVEIPEGTGTSDTLFAMSGTARPNSTIYLLIDGVQLGLIAVDGNGNWTYNTGVQTSGPHSYAIKGNYDSGPVSTPPRTLTVLLADVKPVITSAKGSPSGDEIPPDGFTVETAVTLSGVAAKGQKVDVLLGSVSQGQPVADLGTGIWTLLVTGLTAVLHSFTAKALYGSGQSSQEYKLTVTALVTPTLDNVLDADNREVPEGTETVSTSLKLRGTASKGHEVEIYDGSGPSAVPKGKAKADETTGVWEITIDVELGDRRLYAKSRYHSTDTFSNVRNLKVVARTAYEEFETGVLGSIPINTERPFPTMTVKAESDHVHLKGDLTQGSLITGKSLYIALSASIRITLNNAASTIKFGIVSRHKGTAKFLDENNYVISEITFPTADWMQFSAPAGRKIKAMVLKDGGSYSYIDNFTITY